MGKIIDLKGQRFGRLTVLSLDTEKHNQAGAYWICQCDCGNQKSIKSAFLRNGQTKSCGCLAKELSSARNRKDLIGQVFGDLLVLKDSGERQQYNILWECQCQRCGDIVKVRGSHLLEKNGVKSCKSCAALIKDFEKKRFGYLTVQKYNKETKKWLCLCDCGNYKEVAAENLTSGKTKSCGCIKSRGEKRISELLIENNFLFNQQKSFDTCIFPTGRKALFDFWVENKYLIEFDGEQHFKEGTGHFNNPEAFQKTQERDQFKNQWCQDNKIPLIRIPYTQLEQLTIEDLLLETSSFIVVKPIT